MTSIILSQSVNTNAPGIYFKPRPAPAQARSVSDPLYGTTLPEHLSTTSFANAISLEVYPPATDNKALREVFALRYRIYCKERKFMRAEDYPSGLESDSDDQRSVHFASRNSRSDLVGCSRLILGKYGSELLPTQTHCVTYADFVPPAAREAAEVSRLAFSRDFADIQRNALVQRSASATQRISLPPRHFLHVRQPARPRKVVLELYREMYRYSREHGIRYWYAAMEKSLVRLLARLGVEFTKIGPLQHYHGPVMPCICDLDQLGKQLGNNNPGLLRWLRQQV